MHGNGAFNGHIRVLLSCIEVFKLSVQSVKSAFYFSTTSKVTFLRTTTVWVCSSNIVFALNLIFVCHHELRNHVPEQMLFVFLT
jgi:hypothetical protein